MGKRLLMYFNPGSTIAIDNSFAEVNFGLFPI